MQYIRLVSDIHLDFDVAKFHQTKFVGTAEEQAYLAQEGDMAFLWTPEELPEDKETTLVLAGDLWIQRKFLTRKYSDGESWLQKLAPRFKYIIVVLGNHDLWDANITTEHAKIRAEIMSQGIFDTVFLLEDEVKILDQVKFVGSTLWTDFCQGDPIVLYSAKQVMNDYRRISTGATYGKVRPEEIYKIHQLSANFLFKNVARDNPEQLVCVVTHMAPSAKSINERYLSNKRDQIANFLYYSDLEQRIFDHGQNIDLWFHGHTHHAVEYTLFDHIQVVCNPRGYDGIEDTGYDPLWRIDVEEVLNERIDVSNQAEETGDSCSAVAPLGGADT